MAFSDIRERIEKANFYTLYLRSPAAIARYQDKALRKLVAHAEQNIALWRTVLRERDMPASSFQGIRDLHKLPIVTKDDFRMHPREEYIDTRFRFPEAMWSTTSGSTGKPFHILQSTIRCDDEYICFGHLRFLAWRDRPVAELPFVRRVKIRQTPIKGTSLFFINVGELLQNPSASMRRIAAYKPEVLESTPSVLLKMAQFLEENPSEALRVKYVISVSEMLSRSARLRIERAFGGEVYDRYASEEFTTIATECSHHRGVHIHAESFIVEIVDKNGLPVPEGREGRILVTDLLNYNMPFIRYEIGDRGMFLCGVCPCGLKTPRLAIHGRHGGQLRFGEREIDRMEFEARFKPFADSILQYQIAKTGPGELTVRIVPIDSIAAIGDNVRDTMKELAGDAVRIKIETVSEIAPTANGKSLTIVDESTNS